MTNHYRVFKDIVSCGGRLPAGDTATLHLPINCPGCRAKLAAKAEAERRASLEFVAGSQERAFHEATARTFEAYFLAA